MEDEDRAACWDHRMGMPLTVLSVVYLASYTVWVLGDGLWDGWRTLSLVSMFLSWGVFAVDYAVRWLMSGPGAAFVRRHTLDTLVLLLPLLRPLRIVQAFQRVQRRSGRPLLPLHARVIAYAGLSTLLLGFTGALAVYQQERGAPGASIRTFGDSLWWTCSTLSTVGYGDAVPVTTKGRVIAAGVMAGGLALLGAVTGSVSSWALQAFSREDDTRPPGS